jgi:hypothetical protein
VLTHVVPYCAVLLHPEQEEITKESLRDFNMKVRWQGHVNTLPADHLGRVRAGERCWKQYSIKMYQISTGADGCFMVFPMINEFRVLTLVIANDEIGHCVATLSCENTASRPI